MTGQWKSHHCSSPWCNRIKASKRRAHCCAPCKRRSQRHTQACQERNTRRVMTAEEVRREFKR